MEGKVHVIEKNPGAKIQWEQSGGKIIFGDDELSIRCDRYQRDYPVHLDVCADENKNLVIGVGVGRYYVAQLDIPPAAYAEREEEETVVLPIDMSGVVLTLWSLDDLMPAKQ